MIDAPKIQSISLHVGQMVLGTMSTSVDSTKHAVTLVKTPEGIDIITKAGVLAKTIPYSNIQGIDYPANITKR